MSKAEQAQAVRRIIRSIVVAQTNIFNIAREYKRVKGAVKAEDMQKILHDNGIMPIANAKSALAGYPILAPCDPVTRLEAIEEKLLEIRGEIKNDGEGFDSTLSDLRHVLEEITTMVDSFNECLSSNTDVAA